MRDGTINGKFKEMGDYINSVNQQQQKMAHSLQNILDSYRADIINMFIYNRAVEKYSKKYWFIPRGLYPFGVKLFDKVHQKLINEHKERERKQQEEYIRFMEESKKASEDVTKSKKG